MRARLLAAQGDTVGAILQLGIARKTWPNEGSLFATAAEIYALGGRLESAQDEIRAGLAVAGATPELNRARGVLLLLQPGGAKAGLLHLIEATQADPGLFFCVGPLAEAHRLLAAQALVKEQPEEALVHVRAGLALEPDHEDLKLLLADALLAAGDYDAALPAYENLAKEGREFGASLQLYFQRGATAALLEHRPEVALERYLRARQLGASDADLGFGVQVLHDAATKVMAGAETAYAEARYDDARHELERSLELEPANLTALNLMGVVCFKLSDFESAERAWTSVLDGAARAGVTLPDPVHLNLARALHSQGKSAQIRALLERYLAEQPSGEWVQVTREMLARVPDSGH